MVGYNGDHYASTPSEVILVLEGDEAMVVEVLQVWILSTFQSFFPPPSMSLPQVWILNQTIHGGCTWFMLMLYMCIFL